MLITRGSKALLAVVALLVSFPISAETITGHVVSVYDGDTLTLLDADNKQVKIRFAEIDAPYMQVNTIRSR